MRLANWTAPAILIVLTISIFLPASRPITSSSPGQTTAPASVPPTTSSIYKVGTELKSIEKGDVSTYYQVNQAGWQQHGYSALLWAMCSDCHTRTPDNPPLPVDGGFDQGLYGFAPDGRPWWLVNDTSTSVPGTYVAKNSTDHTQGGTKASFHSKVVVSGGLPGYSGVTQNLTDHHWTAPLVSNVLFNVWLYPVKLENADSLIVFRFDLSYWDQLVTPDRMYVIFHGGSPGPIDSSFGIVKDKNTIVIDRTGQDVLKPGSWNLLSWNLTDLAIHGFGGYWRGVDHSILSLSIQSWSRNGATSDFYVDSLSLKSSLDAQQSHQNEEQILAHYNSTAFPLYSGVTDFTEAQDVIWFGTNNYPVFPSGTPTNQFTDVIRANGGYPFLAAPFVFPNNIYDVTAVPVFSDALGWAGTGSWANGIGIWDNYLNSGRYVMGYVEQHPFTRSAVSYYSGSGGPATFVYSDSLSMPSIVEAMAQGRSFGEYGWISPRMNLYFAAENDAVQAGRFPIYVGPSATGVALHVRISPVPALTSHLWIRIIENGNDIQHIALPPGSYDQVLNFPLVSSSGVDYFRYEIFSDINPILAYSNPIIFMRTSALAGNNWIAETPGLTYGTANSFLSDASSTSTSINFKINAQSSLPVTTTIYSALRPSDVTGASSWTFDSANKLITITTLGSQTVAISFAENFDLSISSNNITMLSGETGNATVTIESLYGFADTVNLATATIAGPRLLCNLSPRSVYVDNNTLSANSLLSCSGVAGQYNLTITGSNGPKTKTVLVTVSIRDFDVSSNPSTLTLLVGEAGTSTISARIANTLRAVTLGIGLLSNNNLTCTLSETNVSSSQPSVLSCTGKSYGNYTVSVDAVGGSSSQTLTILVIVQDFNLGSTVANLKTDSNTDVSSTITVHPLNGFAQSVTFTYASTPTRGLSCSFSPGVGRPPTMDSLLTCHSSSGNYTVTVTAVANGLSHATPLTVYVISRASGPSIIGSIWPYVLFGAAATILSGLVLSIARRKPNTG